MKPGDRAKVWRYTTNKATSFVEEVTLVRKIGDIDRFWEVKLDSGQVFNAFIDNNNEPGQPKLRVIQGGKKT
jgi:hypothetical protein